MVGASLSECFVEALEKLCRGLDSLQRVILGWGMYSLQVRPNLESPDVLLTSPSREEFGAMLQVPGGGDTERYYI